MAAEQMHRMWWNNIPSEKGVLQTVILHPPAAIHIVLEAWEREIRERPGYYAGVTA